MDNKLRHLSVTRSRSGIAGNSLHKSDKTHIRTYLCVGRWRQIVPMERFSVEALLANCTRLRALDLTRLYIKIFPESIGQLLHLRYLDLSGNGRLEVLPKSITKLYNLQTLMLDRCSELKELPKDLSRLVKLRALSMSGCDRITCMPKGMGKLTRLRSLSNFIVGSEGNCSSSKQWFDGLKDLEALNNLKGDLNIKFQWPKNATNVVNVDRRTGGLYLRNKEPLKSLWFDFCYSKVDGDVDTEEGRRLMEELRPHSKLKELLVMRYRGIKMPSWTTLLPNLVHVHLLDCEELGYLPCLGNLCHLKYLALEGLTNLEYIEISPSVFNSTPGLGCAEGISFFVSLKTLDLRYLPKFKGWAGVGAGDDLLFLDECENIQLQLRLCLSQLKNLIIDLCPKLMCMPSCPGLEDLYLGKFNKRLQMIKTCFKKYEKLGEVPRSSVFCHDLSCPSPSKSLCDHEKSSSNSIIVPVPTLRKVSIDNVAWLNSLPMEAFQGLKSLTIRQGQLDESIGEALESLEEVEDVFRNCSSSLQTLEIISCNKLRSMSGGLEHLIALKELPIIYCPNVRLSEEREDAPWRSLHHSLRSLRFESLPQLASLPNWMQSLAALEYLRIDKCKTMESIPNWMSKLTSLSRLDLWHCSESLEKDVKKTPLGRIGPTFSTSGT
ncbi:hypothetical protein SOVF_076290 [Spinacia oleracea]|nr:hypothetical protein SOVF_076290 [Spinacia oleracea]